MIVEELTDYSELDGLIDPKVCPHPEMSRCFVLRDNAAIKGYCFIQTIFSVEPLYVVPEARNSMAVYRLFKAACECLKNNQQTHILTHSSGPEVSNYLTRLGLKPTGYEAFTGEI